MIAFFRFAAPLFPARMPVFLIDSRRRLAHSASLLLLAATSIAAPAHAQEKKSDFGQESDPLPGFESKSEVREARVEPPPGATVSRFASERDRGANVVYYRYKGVDLPLKKHIEYEGSQPFVTIVDGEDTLWVARRADLYRMLDLVLYNQLDTMTGAADALYERHRFPSAYLAYKEVLEVLSAEKNDLTSADLRHYPAVRSYLQFKMGQSRSWESHARWREAEAAFKRADDARAHAARVRVDPDRRELADVWTAMAGEHDAAAGKLAGEALALGTEARTLLEAAATVNGRLWQAHNELGILAAERAARRAAQGDAAGTEAELAEALARFQDARRGDAKEIVDGNLIAVHSNLADIAHAKGRYGEALEHVRKAMELAPDRAETATTANYEVTFTGFHAGRGEQIVVTAEVAAGLARKYLSIERDRRAMNGREPAEVEESQILARWKKQGEALLAKKRWRSAVGFFTALHDEYGLADGNAAVPADFRAMVGRGLEKAFGQRALALLEDGRDDAAIRLYALALHYLPDSTVLNQAHVLQASRQADRALAAGKWEQALEHLAVVQRIYADYHGEDVAKLETRASVALKLGAAYTGLTRAALDRGDLDAAMGFADSAMELSPLRPEWKENKARVLIAAARKAEQAGNLDIALARYHEARDVGAGALQVRAIFAGHTLQARLQIPRLKRKVAAATRSYGAVVVLGVLGLVAGIPATRGAMTAASRRRRARRLRDEAQRAYDAKNWNEAVDLFNDYLLNNLGMADPVAYELLARAYRKIGDYENALRFFEKASKRIPGRRYNLERAEIYLMKRNLPLALQALRTSATVEDDAARLVNFLNYLRETGGESLFHTEALAQVQIMAGDLDAGRQLYKRLLELEPHNPRTLRALAEVARRAGEAAERRGYLEQLVRLDPSDANSQRELGNLFATEGRLQQAIEHFRRAFEVAPAEGLAARIAELQAEYLVREAESEIDRLKKELPTPNRRFRIGELYWRLGKGAEAKPFFEETATTREFQARALRYLGLIALAEGNPEDAISLLRGYLAKRTNLAPDAPEKEARYALAQAYEQAGQAEQAVAQYEAIFEADAGYKDVARKVKQTLTKSALRKGPQDCPFCKRKVPGDAEYCPNCNFNLGSGAPAKYENTPTPTVTSPALALPGRLGEDLGDVGDASDDDDPTKSGAE